MSSKGDSSSKLAKQNYHLNIAILVLVLLGSFLSWEKNNEGQDFLDNYVKDQTKWMIIDLILFGLLALLIYVNRKTPRQHVYIMLLVLLVVMKLTNMYNASQLQSADNPSGGSKYHLNDMYYRTLFDGIVIGAAAYHLITCVRK